MNRNRVDNSSFLNRADKVSSAVSPVASRCVAGLPFRYKSEIVNRKLEIGRFSAAKRNCKSEIVNRKSEIGFTLVEMFVAVLILLVSVALIMGVGAMVLEHSRNEETRNIQSILRSALKLYHDKHHVWPPGEGAEDSTVVLLQSLRAEKAARSELAKLPLGVVIEDNAGREYVLDGFGNKMRYYQTGGLAGRAPMLSSLGSDPKDPADDIDSDVN